MRQNVDNLKQVNHLKRIAVVVVLAALVFMMGFFAAGCGNSTPLLEDILPSSYGEPEGLWLYKGDMRSRTDGSDAEKVLYSVRIGDTTYSSEEFRVIKYTYVVSDHIIFFVITLVDETSHLYLYDYHSKSGDVLFSSTDEEMIGMSSSSTFVYIECMKRNPPYLTTDYLLYSLKGELLCDSIQGSLSGDILYASYVDDGSTFVWYKDGMVRRVNIPDDNAFGSRNNRFGDYMYFLNQHTVYVIDLNTAECKHIPLLDSPEHIRFYHSMCYVNGEVYMASTVQIVTDDGVQQLVRSLAYLHRFVGTSAELVYSFGESNRITATSGVTSGENTLRVVVDRISSGRGGCSGSNSYDDYYHYNLTTREMKSVSSREPFSPGTPAQSIEKKLVNGYTFYIDYENYRGERGMLGSYHTERCYFLYRESPDGETEIMQYKVEDGFMIENDSFYDDICAF